MEDNSGASYVIFGGQGVSDSAIVYDGTSNTLTGDERANQIIGGAGDDILIGNGGADVLRGGGGNDVLAISDDNFSIIDGGLGIDTLRLDSTMILNLTNILNNRVDSIEVIDLNGTASTLALTTDDILSIVGSEAQNTLRIDGDSTDNLRIGALFSDSETTQEGTNYRIYQPADSLGLDDSVTLLVAPEVNVEEDVAIELATISNNNDDRGFLINGVTTEDQSGYSVSGAGDVNGDGLADLIIGANRADSNGLDSGASYVVFGKSDGGAVELRDIGGDNNDGFVLNGVTTNDSSGTSVSGAGDINGDGFDDIIIGANLADPNGAGSSGTSYVVFGKSDGGVVQLSDIADNAGFVLNGVDLSDQSGFSVSGAGDVNGDGLDDIIIGAFQADPNGNASGESYLVFGKSDAASVELSVIADADANNNAGFVINGVTNGDFSGASVSGAGDVNGDGLDDIIIGANQANPNGNNNSGASYVVFGKTDGGVVQLRAVDDATNNAGFVINGVNANDRSGYSVSGAGDVNGDGLADIIVGAYQADPNGGNSGASYVVFGKCDGGVVQLRDIDDANNNAGFVINGVNADDRSASSVSGAGDINGDGLDDLIVGARYADPNGNSSGSPVIWYLASPMATRWNSP